VPCPYFALGTTARLLRAANCKSRSILSENFRIRSLRRGWSLHAPALPTARQYDAAQGEQRKRNRLRRDDFYAASRLQHEGPPAVVT
jgi:hypothetical protein